MCNNHNNFLQQPGYIRLNYTMFELRISIYKLLILFYDPLSHNLSPKNKERINNFLCGAIQYAVRYATVPKNFFIRIYKGMTLFKKDIKKT
jgi:hypothetical protein